MRITGTKARLLKLAIGQYAALDAEIKRLLTEYNEINTAIQAECAAALGLESLPEDAQIGIDGDDVVVNSKNLEK